MEIKTLIDFLKKFHGEKGDFEEYKFSLLEKAREELSLEDYCELEDLFCGDEPPQKRNILTTIEFPQGTLCRIRMIDDKKVSPIHKEVIESHINEIFKQRISLDLSILYFWIGNGEGDSDDSVAIEIAKAIAGELHLPLFHTCPLEEGDVETLASLMRRRVGVFYIPYCEAEIFLKLQDIKTEGLIISKTRIEGEAKGWHFLFA